MSKDTIYRQEAIDAVCSVCGNDCDKSEFVYNAPQDEQVILCPEHYCLCTLPSAQPEIIRCKDCKYQVKNSNEVESWNICGYRPWLYVPIDDEHYCGNAERRTDG